MEKSGCITPEMRFGLGAEYFNISKEIPSNAPLGGKKTSKAKKDNKKRRLRQNKLKNAILIANELISMLPAAEAPAYTEDYEGYYHVSNISGNESSVKITMNIREFSAEKFKQMKQFMLNLAAYLNGVCMEKGLFPLKWKISSII